MHKFYHINTVWDLALCGGRIQQRRYDAFTWGKSTQGPWWLFLQSSPWTHTTQSFSICPWALALMPLYWILGAGLQVSKSVCGLLKRTSGFQAAFHFTGMIRQNPCLFSLPVVKGIPLPNTGPWGCKAQYEAGLLLYSGETSAIEVFLPAFLQPLNMGLELVVSASLPILVVSIWPLLYILTYMDSV